MLNRKKRSRLNATGAEKIKAVIASTSRSGRDRSAHRAQFVKCWRAGRLGNMRSSRRGHRVRSAADAIHRAVDRLTNGRICPANNGMQRRLYDDHVENRRFSPYRQRCRCCAPPAGADEAAIPRDPPCFYPASSRCSGGVPPSSNDEQGAGSLTRAAIIETQAKNDRVDYIKIPT